MKSHLKYNQLMLNKINRLLHYLTISRLTNKNCGKEQIRNTEITCIVTVTWSTAWELSQDKFQMKPHPFHRLAVARYCSSSGEGLSRCRHV